MATEGSTCFCSNQKPQDSNKVDDAKCDKPCLGYPFEKCGAASVKSIANVLLVGSSPPSSSSPPSNGGTNSTNTNNNNGNSNSNSNNNNNAAGNGDGTNKGAIGMGEEGHGGSSGHAAGDGKELQPDSPGGTLPGSSSKGSMHLGEDGDEGGSGLASGTPSPEPPQGSRESKNDTSAATPTTPTTPTNKNSNTNTTGNISTSDPLQENAKHSDGVGSVAKEADKDIAQSRVQSKLPQGTSSHAIPTHHTPQHPQYSFLLPSGREGNGSTSDKGSGGSSAGAIAASVVAILGLAGLFAVALVFQKRRRQKLEAHATWSENMPLPSSLLTNSSTSDDEGAHHHRHHSVRRHGDYSRLTPGYHHASSSMDGSIPPPTPATALPPPPVFHPRQNMHLHQPSYPPPPGHFNRHQFVSHGLHEPMMTERPSNNPQAIIAGQVSAGYEYCPSLDDGGDGYGFYAHPSSDPHIHSRPPADLPLRRGSHSSVHGQHTRESMDSTLEYQ
ncbi:hypothetical protein DFQ26_005218 [Actinomortierella ambigua]|nr:hypothetical protein DFQ26_005218 [Actinomortierella ambigua]